MERRQTHATNIFHNILEEKCVVNDNLDKVINQVLLHVDQAKLLANNMRPKDMTQVLQVELDVLKKLININLELETFIETMPSISQNSVDQTTDTQQPEVLIPEFEPETVSNAVVENELFSSVHHFSDPDVKIVRDTFKEISQKLGLNTPSLNSMKNFYEKPSTSALREFHNITLSDVSNGISRISDNFQEQHATNSDETNSNESNSGESISDSFQIPEKDLNTTNIKDPSVQICDNTNDISAPQLLNFANRSPILLVEESTDGDSDQFDSIYTANNSSQENGMCIQDKLDNTDGSSDDTNFVTNNLGFEARSSGSVLEKLNNYKLIYKENNLKMEPLELPDLKLKPSKQEEIKIIQNINQKEMKKKNKVKKKVENDIPVNKIYVLKNKRQPKENEVCAFSHIESPSEFYINMVNEEITIIDDISNEIYKQYNNSAAEYETKGRACKGIEKFCCAYVPTDESWYRAKVIDWLLEEADEDVLVQLVDCGYKCKISFKYLRKLKKEFSRIPMLAIRCHFPVMYPPDSTNDNRLIEWPVTTLEEFRQLSGLNDENNEKMFKLCYVSYDQELHSFAIDLINIQDGEENTTVGEILLDLGLAIQIVDEDYGDPNLGEFLQDIEELENDENINEAITGYDARDEARICRFTRPDGTCYKGKNCKLDHIPFSQGGFTTDKEIVFKEAMYNLILPAVGMWSMVLITSYVDTCNFFVQIINTPYKGKNYIMDIDLFRLVETMNSPRVVRTYERFKVAPAIGEIVIAQHWTKKWQRAIVREFSTGQNGEPSDVHIFNVDFGDNQKVSIHNIRKIKPQFLELPFQAVLCYIHNYKMPRTCNTKLARKFFNDNMYFHNFLANIMSSQLPLKLELRTRNSQVNIGESLQQNGFAVLKKIDIHPSDECSLYLY